jgi:hypothetical protein
MKLSPGGLRSVQGETLGDWSKDAELIPQAVSNQIGLDTPHAATGVVQNVSVNSCEDASVSLLREAAYRRDTALVCHTDEELENWATQSAQAELVLLEVVVHESMSTRTLAWFRDDFPHERLCRLAAVETIADLTYQNVPLYVDTPMARLADRRRANAPDWLARYDAMLETNDVAGLSIDDAIAVPTVMTPLLIALLFVFSGQLTPMVILAVLIGWLVLVYGLVSALWPTDTLYGRELKPAWLLGD